ncbi:V-type ATP synthase subunit F [Pseudonocardia broussonetiae]|uniref:V-type ATP synthase subunit F n=1 Tax=Pseudonocardia broussonetiae TaxID=2736640 RepID=A0A6M6JVR7_9PSEU|nr:V-type ATP synthase subunit F [Pseudonocardia broussonetiae]QJY51147.1 hypothetical protein HOP40_34770 [Pseudonocardia broussonetiae]
MNDRRDTAATTRSTPLAGDLLVVVPELLAPAFALAGTRVAEAGDGAEVERLVAAELDTGRPGVVAVHPQLWQQVPPTVRAAWERRSVPLVIALPDDSGPAGEGRRHAVRELLARSVGYEITFGPGGPS